MNVLIEWPLIIMYPKSLKKNIEKESFFVGVYCGNASSNASRKLQPVLVEH